MPDLFTGDIWQLFAAVQKELELVTTEGWWQKNYIPLINIIMIDVVLAGDNAIVVGVAASRVDPKIRSQVIFWGILGAVVLRIIFAAMTTQLLQIVGLTLGRRHFCSYGCAGRCTVRYRPLTKRRSKMPEVARLAPRAMFSTSATARPSSQIILADVSMSLDNVLAVAGAAQGQPARARHRSSHCHCADGHRIAHDRAPAGAISLDHVGGAVGHPLRRARHDLRRLGRGLLQDVRVRLRSALPTRRSGNWARS